MQEDERRRIAPELHDEAGQVLTAVKIELELDGRQDAGAMVGRALAQVRDISNLLRPSALDDLGLRDWRCAPWPTTSRRARASPCSSTSTAPAAGCPEVEVVIYRVVQEALTNVARHAGATDVRVRVVTDERACAGGRGQRPRLADDASPQMGWLGMRERVTALGGRLTIGPGRAAASGSTPIPIGERRDAGPVRVLLADDHTLVRSGIRRILEGQPGVEVVAEAADGASAVVCAHRAVDVPVLDLKMPGTGGSTCSATPRRRARAQGDRAHDARRPGVRGPGGAGRRRRLSAEGFGGPGPGRGRRRGHRRPHYFSPPIEQHMAECCAATPGRRRAGTALTEREREVLAWLARGLSSHEVAKRLDISVRTVETHRANLMQKLGVKSVALLIQVAIREGILDRP